MHGIEKLLQIMVDLRDPEAGCPWDVKQNFKSIAAYTVEEAYEVADAIEREDLADLKNELGDLLFQVVFHSQMAAENNQFDFSDVVQGISDKLVRRHPHVFSDDMAQSKVMDDVSNEARDVARDEKRLYLDWENHKKKERAEKFRIENDRTRKSSTNETGISSNTASASYLDGIAASMPALRWSEKLQKRAAHHGFDWESIAPVFDKLQEEIGELKAEIVIEDNQQRITDEMGDVLFASVSLSRHLGVNPEQALRDSNRKFIKRFTVVEQLLEKDDRKMEECSVAILEDYWKQAKKITG